MLCSEWNFGGVLIHCDEWDALLLPFSWASSGLEFPRVLRVLVNHFFIETRKSSFVALTVSNLWVSGSGFHGLDFLPNFPVTFFKFSLHLGWGLSLFSSYIKLRLLQNMCSLIRLHTFIVHLKKFLLAPLVIKSDSQERLFLYGLCNHMLGHLELSLIHISNLLEKVVELIVQLVDWTLGMK